MRTLTQIEHKQVSGGFGLPPHILRRLELEAQGGVRFDGATGISGGGISVRAALEGGGIRVSGSRIPGRNAW